MPDGSEQANCAGTWVKKIPGRGHSQSQGPEAASVLEAGWLEQEGCRGESRRGNGCKVCRCNQIGFAPSEGDATGELTLAQSDFLLTRIPLSVL